MEKLYTAEQLADLLQVHKETIYRLGREGKIGRKIVGRSVRFYLSEGVSDVGRKNDSEVCCRPV